MRVRNQDTKAKYYNYLVVLKEKIDNGEVVKLNRLSTQYNVTKALPSILKKLNVLSGRLSTLKWNEKIPPSIALVNKIQEFISEEYKTYKQKELFDIPQKQLPKSTKVIKKQSENFDNDLTNYLSIAEAINCYGKSESTIRNIVRLGLKKKGVIKHEALKNGSKKIYISIDYLDSIFTKKIVKNIDNDLTNYLSIDEAVKYTNLSLSTIRRYVKGIKASNSHKAKKTIKSVASGGGKPKDYISIFFLDSIKNDSKDYKVELGVIRKFLKWLW